MFRQTALLYILILFTASVCNSSEVEELFPKGNDLLIKENFRQALVSFETALKLSEQQKDNSKTADALYKMTVARSI
jgi:hypothetical protein